MSNFKAVEVGDVVHIVRNRFGKGKDEIWELGDDRIYSFQCQCETNGERGPLIAFNQLNSNREIEFNAEGQAFFCSAGKDYHSVGMQSDAKNPGIEWPLGTRIVKYDDVEDAYDEMKMYNEGFGGEVDGSEILGLWSQKDTLYFIVKG